MPGTVEKRGANSWRIGISGGYDEAGKRIWLAREKLSFDSSMTEAAQRKECEKRLALLYARVDAGQIIDAKQVTVREFAERWMHEHVEPNLAQQSAENYRGFLDRHIVLHLGHIKLSELKPYAITKFLNQLRADGMNQRGGKLSGTTINHYYRTLSAMLSMAVRWQAIPYSPLASVSAQSRIPLQPATMTMCKRWRCWRLWTRPRSSTEQPSILRCTVGCALVKWSAWNGRISIWRKGILT